MKKYLRLSGKIFLLSISALQIVSCSAEKDQSELQAGTRNITIRSVRFTQDDNVTDVNPVVTNGSSDKLAASTKSAAAVSNTALNSNALPTFTIQSAAEFDYTTDLQSNATQQNNGGLKAATKTNGLKAADVPMDQSKKYRLIFIQDGSSTPLYNEVLSSGQNPNLTVRSNSTYQWYALSINDVNTAPNINGSGTIAAADLSNKDFMFASGEITTSEGENYLDILFIRQMAAVEVNINTRGIFGGITDNSTFSVGTGTGTGFSSIIQTGDFNIFNATFSNLQDAGTISSSAMTVVDSRWGNAQKVAHFYTANTGTTIAANSLTVRLNSLGITLDNNTVRTFAANTTVPIRNAASLALTKGTLSKTNVRLIESGINVNGVIWARTNLTYNAVKLYGSDYVKDISDAYRFRPNNEYAYSPSIDFWNFGTATPTGKDYASVDQCKRVYPENTWRLPSEDHNTNNTEGTNLANNTNRAAGWKAVSDGNRYQMEWNTSQAANSAYPDAKMLLSYYGYRNTSGQVVSQVSGSPGNGTASGHLRYRTNRYSNTDRVSYVIFGNINNGNVGNLSVGTESFGNGANVRCVRAVVNN